MPGSWWHHISACLPAPAQVELSAEEEHLSVPAWTLCLACGRKLGQLHGSRRISEPGCFRRTFPGFILDGGPCPLWGYSRYSREWAQVLSSTSSLVSEPQSVWSGRLWRSAHVPCLGTPGEAHRQGAEGTDLSRSGSHPGHLSPLPPLGANAWAWERLHSTAVTFMPDLPL